MPEGSGGPATLLGVSAIMVPERSAFVDESFQEADVGGYYVLAAVVFEPELQESARAVMRELRGARDTRKLHWNEMDAVQRHAAAKTVADLEGFYIVTVGSPVPSRRQERARAACLTRLVMELHGYGITELLVEARTAALDARDIRTVRGARFSLPKGTEFRVEHIPGKAEALFWAADIVAGAVRAGREGIEDYVTLLKDCLYAVSVVTDC